MPRHSSSAFFQFERTQTALRMRQSQARFWRPFILTVWLVGAAVYLYVSIGETGRSYFLTWLSATLWGSLWPRHLVPFQGTFYEPNTLALYLQKKFYGNSLPSLLIESLVMGLLPPVACVAGLVLYALKRSQKPKEEHIRGVQLATSQQLQRKINGPRKWRWDPAANPPGISVAGISIPRELETKHLAIAGSTGTGKSTILRGLLHQISQRGEVAIVCDPECELTPEFYDPHRGDTILNPIDARCPYWSPWLEMGDMGDAQRFAADATALATSIVPDPAVQSNGNEMYFIKAARQLFVTLLEQLPTKDPQDLSRVLFGPLKELLKLIENTPSATDVLADAPEQRGGVLSTLQIALQGLRFLPSRLQGLDLLPPTGRREWSALLWQDTRNGWLFLPSQERSRDAILSMQSVWLDSLIRCLLDTPLGRVQDQRVWIVIDELATLRRLQHLEAILTRGRKRGVSVVVGFQAMPQLRRIYGRDTTATVLAAPKTKLLFQTGEPETAKWCSDAIGSREVIYPQENETAGSADTRDSMGVSYPRKNEAVVMDSEILQLPDLNGYLIVAGYGVARVEFPYLKGKEKEPGFIPRIVSQTPPQPPTEESIPPVQTVRKASAARTRV